MTWSPFVEQSPSVHTAIEKVVVAHELTKVTEPWSPRIVAELNGQHVKLAKLAGEFVWHHHELEDELFLVVRGRLRMELRDRAIELGPGELVVIPRGVEHRPVAAWGECEVLLFEPASTLNTGSAPDDPRTRRVLDHI